MTDAQEHNAVDVLAAPNRADPVAFGLQRVSEALERRRIGVREIEHDLDALAQRTIAAALVNEPGRAFDVAQQTGPVAPGEPESFSICAGRVADRRVVAITGADPTGLMYGLLELAERIDLTPPGSDPLADMRSSTASPVTGERSMSIYTMHRTTWENRLHDHERWHRTFETMAESRLDSLTIIFGYENGGYMAPAHPYFFNVHGFPGVRVVGLSDSEQKRNRDSFRRMIDTAHSYGVGIVAGLWDHIYRGAIQDGGIADAARPGESRPGIVSGITGENVRPYNTAAIARFLKEFDRIDGLQFRMHGESGLTSDEMFGFWHDVFGIIRSERPDLRIDIRVKELPDEIIADAVSMGLRIRLTTKYWMEQLGLPFHPTHVNPQNQHDRRHGYADLLRRPKRASIHWRLWNAVTHGGLTWCDPEWVRRFVRSVQLAGDSFEFNEPDATWMLGQPHDREPVPALAPAHRWYRDELERHRHTLRLFGRIGFDPDVTGDVWERDLAERFGDAGRAVMRAVHLAGGVVPRIVGSTYCYSMFATTAGSAARDSQGPLAEFALAEGSDVQQFVSLREEANLILRGGRTARRRPGSTAAWFAARADAILAEADVVAAHGPLDGELATLACDARILGHLARFYSIRIPAAVSWNLYVACGDLSALRDAVEGERRAVAEWGALVEAAGDVYSYNLPIGVRRPALVGHWRDEHARLAAWLADLADELQARESTAIGPASLLAHVPVRRLLPSADFVVRATLEWPFPTRFVVARLLVPDEPARVVPLESAGVRTYQATIPAAELPEAFAYVVEAHTPEGHRIATPGGIEEPIQVMVPDDRQPPSVEHSPVHSTRAGSPMRVEATVTDPAGVGSVRLRYRHLTQYEEFEVLEMTRSGDRFTAEIPAEFIIPEWDLAYFIEAFDRYENGCIHPDLDVETPYIVVRVEA